MFKMIMALYDHSDFATLVDDVDRASHGDVFQFMKISRDSFSMESQSFWEHI